MKERTIIIDRDFSHYPGGRLRKYGEFSAEQFRDDMLAPALRENDRVIVILDGVEGYPSSFLEESFGGLVRECGFSQEELQRRLEIRAFDPAFKIFKQLAEDQLKVARKTSRIDRRLKMTPPSGQQSSLLIDILQWLSGAASGAVFGFVFSALLQRSKSSRDELHIACDELCKAVSDVADLASNYWLQEGRADRAQKEAEARIIGYQRRLSGYAALLRRGLHSEGGVAIDGEMVRLFLALTGGEFLSPERHSEPQRAASIQGCAADLILAIRKAFIDKVDGWQALKRFCARVLGCL